MTTPNAYILSINQLCILYIVAVLLHCLNCKPGPRVIIIITIFVISRQRRQRQKGMEAYCEISFVLFRGKNEGFLDCVAGAKVVHVKASII